MEDERIKVYAPVREDDHSDLVWIPGSLIEKTDQSYRVEVEIEGQAIEIEVDANNPRLRGYDSLPLQNANAGPEGFPDMCDMDFLHEPAVLYNLRKRHAAGAAICMLGCPFRRSVYASCFVFVHLPQVYLIL